LICDSESEKCVSDDYDVEAANDLLEDSDNSVLTDGFWHHSRSEDRVKIHHFHAYIPGVNCCVAPVPHL
jgi:hypothetical protein